MDSNKETPASTNPGRLSDGAVTVLYLGGIAAAGYGFFNGVDAGIDHAAAILSKFALPSFQRDCGIFKC